MDPIGERIFRHFSPEKASRVARNAQQICGSPATVAER